RIVPALMLAVVVPVATIVPMSVVAFVSAVVVLLATITTVIAVLARCGDGQGSCQSHEQCSSNDFAHRSSLQKSLFPLCRFGVSQAVGASSYYLPDRTSTRLNSSHGS